MSLKVAVIFLTPKCNMHCDFCGADAGFDPIPYGRAASLIQRLAREGCQSVVFGGGEPLLWGQDLPALSAYARSLGLLTQIGTNATLAPSDDAGLKAFDRWILPLEGVTGGVHDELREFGSGHLGLVLKLMERLRDNGVEVTVSSLVTRENYDRMLEVGALLRQYQEVGGRLHAWHLYRFLPLGRGGNLSGSRFSTAPGVFASLGEVLKHRFGSLKIYLRPDMYHSKEVAFFWWQGWELKSHSAVGVNEVH